MLKVFDLPFVTNNNNKKKNLIFFKKPYRAFPSQQKPAGVIKVWN